MVITIITMTSVFAQSADTLKVNNPKHQIGGAGDLRSGFGFSYRYWPNKWGIQTTFLPLFSSSYYDIDFGLSGLLKVHENKIVDLFVYISYMENFGKEECGINYITNKPEYDYFQQIDISFGPGFNLHLCKVIDMNLTFGYGIYDVANDYETNFTGSVGLFYKL